jgi:hypothetical protein
MRARKKSEKQENMPIPVLTPDIELRPRSTDPIGVGPLLAPRLAHYVQQLEATLADLQRLAKKAPSFAAEAAITAKLADHLIKLVKVAHHASPDLGATERTGITNKEVPDWKRLSSEVQRNLAYWMDRAREEFQRDGRIE